MNKEDLGFVLQNPQISDEVKMKVKQLSKMFPNMEMDRHEINSPRDTGSYGYRCKMKFMSVDDMSILTYEIEF